MDSIYEIIETLIPAECFTYDFMKNALLAILIITPLFAIMGTLIVNNRMAFFSDALGHSAFTGMALGVILGFSDPGIPMVIYAVLFTIAMNFIKTKSKSGNDTVISVFASLSTAIGLVILSYGGNFSKYSSLLVGDILSIKPGEILSLLITLMVTLIFWCFGFNKLHAASVNSSLAKSKKIKVNLLENAFVILLAVIVMLSIKFVGLLIINALLILPAATSRNISSNMRQYHLFSVLVSVFSGILGLILSFYMDIASGPTIVIIAAICFLISLIPIPGVKER